MKKQFILSFFLCGSLWAIDEKISQTTSKEWFVGGTKRLEGTEQEVHVPSVMCQPPISEIRVTGDLILKGGTVTRQLDVNGWFEAEGVSFSCPLRCHGVVHKFINCVVRDSMYVDGWFEAISSEIDDLLISASPSVYMVSCKVSYLQVVDATATTINVYDCHIQNIRFLGNEPGVVRVHDNWNGRSCSIGQVINGRVEVIAGQGNLGAH